MVEYTAVNLATFLVGLGLLLNGYVIVRRGREDVALFVVSAAVGLGLIVVALVPDVFQVVATLLGLELKARAILVVSNLTLFVVAIYLFNRIGRLYERVSRLNEELSLLRNAVEEGVDPSGGASAPERADGGVEERADDGVGLEERAGSDEGERRDDPDGSSNGRGSSDGRGSAGEGRPE